MPNPMRLAGMDMMDTHPVCRPKYMLEKQMTVPTRSPTTTPRTVKLRPGTVRVAIFTLALGEWRRRQMPMSSVTLRR
jgi:hypothetical protein